MATRKVYCTVDDVQRFVKRVQFNTTTKVTPADVEYYITMASNVVEGEMRKLGVTIPISPNAEVTMTHMKTLVALRAAEIAEEVVNFGSNKTESENGKWLKSQYQDLLEQIRSNPSMLSDVVTGNAQHLQSTTEEVVPGGAREGEEIFTEQHIQDFVNSHKIPSPGEKFGNPEQVDGGTDPTRV